MKSRGYLVSFVLIVGVLVFSSSCKKQSEPEDNTPKTQEYCITVVETFTGNPLTDFRVAMVKMIVSFQMERQTLRERFVLWLIPEFMIYIQT